jgi:hypothetical protein
LEKQAEAHRNDPGLLLTATYVHYIDGQGRFRGIGGSGYHSPEEIRAALDKDVVIGFQHPSVMFRREKTLEFGGYGVGMWPVEDVDLWTRLAEAGENLRVLPIPLIRYRIHSSSGSRTLDSVRKLDWIKARALARRAGQPEPSWEDFQRNARESGLPARLNESRRTLGKYLYRRAAQHWLVGNRLSAAGSLLFSLVLMPSHAAKRMKKFRRRSR